MKHSVHIINILLYPMVLHYKMKLGINKPTLKDTLTNIPCSFTYCNFQVSHDFLALPPSGRTIRASRSMEAVFLLAFDTRLMAVERLGGGQTRSQTKAFVYDLTDGEGEDEDFDDEKDGTKTSLIKKPRPVKKMSKAMKVRLYPQM